MRKLLCFAALLSSTSFLSCSSKPAIESAQAQVAAKPPVAEKQATKLEKHGDIRIDDYFWMKDRENPKVASHLNAENAYVKSVMKPLEPLQEKLFAELKSRIKPDDSSAPVKEGEYYYYRRFEAGKEFPIFCRKKGEAGTEEVILDVNKRFTGQGFLSVSNVVVSPDARLLAFAEDTVGRRIYTIRFIDLASGEVLKDIIPDVTGNLAWSADSKTIFYSKQDLTTLRSQWIYRHQIAQAPNVKDALVFHEKDETFNVQVQSSLSQKFIFIYSHSTVSQETRYLDARQPTGEFKVFQPRKRGLEYSVEDGGDRFYVRTNHKAENFRLMEVPYKNTSLSAWKDVVPHRKDTLISNFAVFKNHLVLQERNNGLTRLNVIERATKKSFLPTFHDPVFTVFIGDNREYDTNVLRYDYESMTTPFTVYEFNFADHKHKLIKQNEIPGGFSSADYVSQRIFANAKDGTMVPISLVYRKSTSLSAATPLLVYGYGSYGYSMEPDFNLNELSLLDRGFVYAIAHVRGGSEMGRSWYLNGRQDKKLNTFTDFISATEALHTKGISSPAHTYAMGGSAGGLLIGSVMNMRPDLYNGMIALVPFVDVVTTMLDTSIPLTTGEFDEWGNPAEKKAYTYIKSYSPYDNVEAKAYPNLLVMTGFHDSQVQYWEPMKWVAKLREKKTDQNLLLFQTNMEAGHGGKMGRFERLKETALRYAFLLMLEGKTDIKAK